MDAAAPSPASTRLVAAALVLLGVAALAGAAAGAGILEEPAIDLHVPAGTLGWLTLAVLAAAAALFPHGDHRPWSMGRLPAAAAAGYVAAAWLGSDAVRAVAATLALAATIGFATGLLPRLRAARPVSVAQAGIALALVLLAAALGLDVLGEVDRTASAGWVPFRAAGARAPSLIAAAVLTGMAVAEARLAPGRVAAEDTWGLTQLGLFGAGWLALVGGVAADHLTLLVGSTGLHVAAVVVFLGRIGPRLGAVRWRGAGPERWLGAVVLYLAAHVGLVTHIGFGIAGRVYLELARVPLWLRFAADHVVFVGIGAGALLGLAGRDPAAGAAFWATHAGLAGFVLGRALNSGALMGAGAAALGGGLLAAAVSRLADRTGAGPANLGNGHLDGNRRW